MVREVPLTRGLVALVDDEDYARVMRHKWSVYAGSDGQPRYARFGMFFDGKYYSVPMHRYILGVPDGVMIDHANGDGLDNRYANLRIARAIDNSRNARRRPRESGFVGVQILPSGGFAAMTRNNGKNLALGVYDTAEEAARVYDAAVRRLHPEFGWTNFSAIDPDADAIVIAILNGQKPIRSRAFRILSDVDVIAARAEYAAGGVLLRELAAKYGVKCAAMSHAVRGHTFRHVPGALTQDKRRKAAA